MDCYPDNTWIEAYTFDSHWNGWGCPYFTKEGAFKLMELQKELIKWSIEKGYPFFTLDYDEARDAFLIGYKDEPNEELIEGQNLEVLEATEKEGLKLYPIGAYSWCWYEIEKEEV